MGASAVKLGGLGISAVILWITGTFGEAFYLLAALLLLDFALNYKDELIFMQKAGYMLLGTASAFYVQNVSNANINIAKGLIVVLAVNELGRVFAEVQTIFSNYQKTHQDVPVPTAPQMETIVQNIVKQMQATNIAVDGGQSVQVDPATVQTAYKVGANGE